MADSKTDAEFSVEFKPLGEAKAIILTQSIVNQYLMVKTTKGHVATEKDVRRFLETCAAQCLNPWLGDAYLIGYDNYDKAGNHTGASFSLVTSHQAILKRAEASAYYDGMRSGVITLPKLVATQIGETGIPPANVEELIKRRDGDLLYPWETVIGGWADVKRKDHAFLSSDALEFEVYTTGKNRWAKDPAGMIVKCAEASAQRKAFPTTLGTLYIQEEMESVQEGRRVLEPIGLTDQREEQDRQKIVFPDGMIDDASRKVTVPATRSTTQEPAKEMPQERELPDGPTYPEPIQKMLESINRAKSEMALSSIKISWQGMKGNHQPESVDAIEAALARKQQQVTPCGEKPRNGQ